MIDFRLEHLFSYAGRLAGSPVFTTLAPDEVGVDFCYAGGEIVGPKLHGQLLPGGSDWITVRSDGVGRLDVRRTLETHDGVSLLAVYQGIVDLGEAGHQGLVRGTLPSVAQLRFSLRLITNNPEYRWLERLHCFGIGEYAAMGDVVRYDVYALHRGRRHSSRQSSVWMAGPVPGHVQ